MADIGVPPLNTVLRMRRVQCLSAFMFCACCCFGDDNIDDESDVVCVVFPHLPPDDIRGICLRSHWGAGLDVFNTSSHG